MAPAIKPPRRPGINLHRDFAVLNESVAHLADSLGVPRSATIPYTKSDMAAHIASVGQVLQGSGGVTKNLLTSFQKGGSHYGSANGETVAHHAQVARETIIPADNPQAILAIGALRTLLNDSAAVLGPDDPAVEHARSVLALIARTSAKGMNVFDFHIALLGLAHNAIQAVARLNSKMHPGGLSPALRAPHEQSPMNNPPEEEEPQAGGNEPQGTPAPQGQPGPQAPPTGGSSLTLPQVVQQLQGKQ